MGTWLHPSFPLNPLPSLAVLNNGYPPRSIQTIPLPLTPSLHSTMRSSHQNSDTTMAEARYYDPRRDGLITLSPETEMIRFGASTQEAPNKSPYPFDPASPKDFGFSFTVPRQLGFHSPVPSRSPSPTSGTPMFSAAPNMHYPTGWNPRSPKRKASSGSTTILSNRPEFDDDEPIDRSKKRRISESSYVRVPASQLIPTDGNTNAHTVEQPRRQKRYPWGTSRLRRFGRQVGTMIPDPRDAIWSGFEMFRVASAIQPSAAGPFLFGAPIWDQSDFGA